ncbi:MFS transporter [Nonomuraea sp. NPDC049421]|uniref:MFS transporter n=1 Tax=Nonomuraea sp. NPDC049421 TaxID=3155275 RepID=UPI0034245D6F
MYSIRSYLAGAVAARAGDEMSGPALMLAGFAVTGSATDATSLLAGITAAAAVGGPLLGALLDRAARPGRLLACALALYAAGLGVILMGLGHLPIAISVVIALFTGLLGPALSGGWTAQLPRVVPPAGLSRANAFDAMTFSVASLAGPALAGGVAELLGAPAAVVVAVALIGFAVPSAWTLPARPPSREAGSLPAGARVMIANRPLFRATLVSVICCTAEGMLVGCLPLLGLRVLGDADRGALLLSCAAAGALAANAVLARRPRSPDTVVWASALLQAAAFALAAVDHAAVLVAAMLLVGIGQGPQLTALFAIRHREAPERLRSQIFTTGASLKITGFALGAAIAGPLATWSLTAALILAATMSALAALTWSRSPRGSRGPRSCASAPSS